MKLYSPVRARGINDGLPPYYNSPYDFLIIRGDICARMTKEDASPPCY